MIVPADWVGFITAWLRTEIDAKFHAHKLPDQKAFPATRVQRVGGGVRDGHMAWVHDPLIQFDTWADTETVCYARAEIVAACIDQEFNGLMTLNGVSIVCSHVTLGGLSHGHDGTLARSTFTARLTAHPVL